MKKLSLVKILNENTGPDFNMFTNFASWIRSDQQLWQYWKQRYGPWTAGQIDDADATFSFMKKKNPQMTSEQFFDWYIKNGIDLSNARENLKNDLRETGEDGGQMAGLIDRLVKMG